MLLSEVFSRDHRESQPFRIPIEMLDTAESDGRIVTDWLPPFSATDIEPLTLSP